MHVSMFFLLIHRHLSRWSIYCEYMYIAVVAAAAVLEQSHVGHKQYYDAAAAHLAGEPSEMCSSM